MKFQQLTLPGRSAICLLQRRKTRHPDRAYASGTRLRSLPIALPRRSLGKASGYTTCEERQSESALLVDQFQVLVQHVEASVIGILRRGTHLLCPLCASFFANFEHSITEAMQRTRQGVRPSTREHAVCRRKLDCVRWATADVEDCSKGRRSPLHSPTVRARPGVCTPGR